MRRGFILCICALTLLALMGCGGAAQPVQKEGVVYLDPNAPRSSQSTAAPAAENTAAPAEPVSASAAEPEEGAPESPRELYFESRGLRLEPMMEAEAVLAALGEPIGTFEADSCAYLGKDLFYYYPGFELTVNEVDGVNVITAISVVDDTVATPQGLRIYDEEEKLLSILGGDEENGVYTYRAGRTELLIQVKETGDGPRRIATMEYRTAEDQ